MRADPLLLPVDLRSPVPDRFFTPAADLDPLLKPPEALRLYDRLPPPLPPPFFEYAEPLARVRELCGADAASLSKRSSSLWNIRALAEGCAGMRPDPK